MWSACYVPGIVLILLDTLCHFILELGKLMIRDILSYRYCNYF